MVEDLKKQVIQGLRATIDGCAKTEDLKDLEHKVLETNATIKVFSYKMDLFKEMKEVESVDKALEEATNETQRLLNSFTPDVAAGKPLQSKDILKMIDSINQSINANRKQMTKLERNRLQDNFNKVPKDIQHLTRSEVELKRNLVNMIEQVEDFHVIQKQELQRLRREHYENDKSLQ